MSMLIFFRNCKMPADIQISAGKLTAALYKLSDAASFTEWATANVAVLHAVVVTPPTTAAPAADAPALAAAAPAVVPMATAPSASAVPTTGMAATAELVTAAAAEDTAAKIERNINLPPLNCAAFCGGNMAFSFL